jgi:hypothetical protein
MTRAGIKRGAAVLGVLVASVVIAACGSGSAQSAHHSRGMTLHTYNALTWGMTRAQVAAVVGEPGKVEDDSTADGVRTTDVVFDGTVTATFQNGRLTSKYGRTSN